MSLLQTRSLFLIKQKNARHTKLNEGLDMRTNVILIGIFISGFFVGCSTTEFIEERNYCSSQALLKYPVNNISKMQITQRMVALPTGGSQCTTNYMGNMAYTNCEPVMRNELKSFQESVTLDTNYEIRVNYIGECIAKSCINKYGNTACEPATIDLTQRVDTSKLKTEQCQIFASKSAPKNNYAEWHNIYDKCVMN